MRFFKITLFACIALLSSTILRAQDIVTVKGCVYTIGEDLKGKEVKEYKQGLYVLVFSTKDAARDFTKQYKKFEFEKGKSTLSEAAGQFSTDEKGEYFGDVFTGSYIVVYHPETKEKPQIKGPVTHSNKTFDFEFEIEGIMLGTVDVKGNKKKKPGIKEGRTRMFGDTIVWNLDFPLPEGYGGDNSRLIIQPYAISCDDNTDTVGILKPIVIEGKEYHTLQNKRKDYDYEPNDPLHQFHVKDMVLSKDSLHVRRAVSFKRPDPKRMYFCAGRILMADYTHITWSNEGDTAVFGSCYGITPFKFLQFDLPNSHIPLDREEFYEPPRIQPRDVSRDLQLSFVVGKAEFTDDSINAITMQTLATELKSYGRSLVSVSIMGSSSPDGGLQLNQSLADRRAALALSHVRRLVPGNHYNVSPPEAKVYTWLDVADSLKNRGFEEEATRLRDVATAKGEYSRDAQIVAKSMAIYDSIIDKQILARQRAMKCSYKFIDRSPLSAEEAAEAWLTKNPDYLPGGTKRFSNGDYFNMLALIKDSVEQRRVVERAHKEITSRSGFKINAFAAYLANRMAIYKIQDGVIDTTLLEPFIDIYDERCDAMKQVSIDNQEKYKVNRNQIVANQALMYLKLGKLGYARMLVDKLPGNLGIKDEITKYADMINLVNYWDDPNLPEDERTQGREALDYVMEKSNVNKAVLTAELHDELEIDRIKAYMLVDSLLSDNNAKKWYLKGMLISSYVGTEEEVLPKKKKEGEIEQISLQVAYEQGVRADSLTLENVILYRELTSNEDMDLPINLTMGSDGTFFQALRDKFAELMKEITPEEDEANKKPENTTPYFLAFMQHAFDMEPALEKHYYIEGNITKMVHDKHKYNKKEAEKYREKFKMITEE